MYSKKRQFGVTLVEVLVTLVVMSVGLLGVAALHTYTLRSNQDALTHAQASALTQDIVDRMRANRQVAVNSGNYLLSYGAAATTVTTEQFTKDLSEWRALLTSRLGAGADGEITRVAVKGTQWMFTIKIRWTDKATNSSGEFVTQAEI